MPALSVIVPCYNVAAFTPTLLASIERNEHDDIEFVMVEDCSTDSTRDILRSATAGSAHMRLVELEVNSGLASARNAGMRAAAGRYVTFLDADDWAAPQYFARLLQTIVELGCAFVRTDHVAVNGRGRRVVRSPERRRHQCLDPRDAILPSNRSTGIDYPYAWAGIYDTEQVPRQALMFDEGLHTAEDRPWIWRVYLASPSHAVVPLPGIFYRRGVASSLTQIGDRRQLDFIPAFELALEHVRNDPEAERFLPKAIRMYCAVIAHHLRTRSRFDRALRRELLTECSQALDRIPADLLDPALTEMGGRRATMLRLVRLRSKVTPW